MIVQKYVSALNNIQKVAEPDKIIQTYIKFSVCFFTIVWRGIFAIKIFFSV